MANLKELVVNGASRLVGKVFASSGLEVYSSNFNRNIDFDELTKKWTVIYEANLPNGSTIIYPLTLANVTKATDDIEMLIQVTYDGIPSTSKYYPFYKTLGSKNDAIPIFYSTNTTPSATLSLDLNYSNNNMYLYTNNTKISVKIYARIISIS